MLLIVVALINYSPVQTKIAQKATAILSKRLKTRVSVENVRIGLLNKLLVQGVYIADQAGDTLFYAGEVQARITDWFVFKNKPVLHYAGLSNAYINLYRKDTGATWNYEFIADALGGSGGKKSANSTQPDINLEKVRLENVRFHMWDAWVGENMTFEVGEALVNADGIDWQKKRINIDEIAIKGGYVGLYEFDGGRPAHLKPLRPDTFDVTPFNPEQWSVDLGQLSLNQCHFSLKSNEGAAPIGRFDETHLDITGIDLAASKINITGDTIKGSIDLLKARERCGLTVKQMRSKVTVSPIASICEELHLETNNSVIEDYYAMRYRHFPNFEDYIDSVEMEARLDKAKVDKRDIMYFAPQLEILPEVRLQVSGHGKGTVANLNVKQLSASDGNMALKGDVTMKGLPDIYTTYITFTNGEAVATGKGARYYAPGLKDNPSFASDSIKYLYFYGDYEGYIEEFKVKGAIRTNLGNAAVDIRMQIPGFKADSATYSGTISTDKLQIGKLLNVPMLGDITLHEKINGESFNPDLMQLDVDGTINEFTVNGYLYHNIMNHGTVAKKQFDGEVLIDDPNLALSFYGGLNYADKQLKINAQAHLLGSDFKALNLTSDLITASADFDMNWTGSNIDNFSGYAKLFNIDMRRNARKLALDSIYVHSEGNDNLRSLNVESDALAATISGNYQLSNLPASIQYYLSRYIPNYVKAPDKYAPDQNMSFYLTTVAVDSILAVAFPVLRGFDHASVNGSLNTSQKKLALNATVPYCRIAGVEMTNVSLIGEGDLDVIALNTTADRLSLMDSALNASLSLTSTIGNDSVSFNLATVSPDKESSISLYGRVVARNDTLTLTIFPSEFFMNKAKWEIPGGSNIVYATNYLSVSDVMLQSGLQRISAATQQGDGQPLQVQLENIDLSQLGNTAGLAALQPDGRLNGVASASNIFTGLQVSAAVRATGVALGTDTIGTVVAGANYDGKSQLLHIDPKSGIFRGQSAVTLSGDISLNKEQNGKITGSVKMRNAQVAWASPFLVGLFSDLKGDVNGSLEIWGTTKDPTIDGRLKLQHAGLKLDYLGCNYTIPEADVHIDNKRIELGDVEILDAYGNTANLTGHFSHDLFDRMRMHFSFSSRKFEVMKLARGENELFYGHMIAAMDSFTVRGRFNDIKLALYGGTPAAKSTLYIPASTEGYTGEYSYVAFKTYGTEQEPHHRKSKDKMSIDLQAIVTPLAEIHIVLDPATEDEIVTNGEGSLRIEIPANNDMRLSGLYTINNGTYTFTFPQLPIHRQFKLNAGSEIRFNGAFAETSMKVDAIYSTRARLIDLLSDVEKSTLRAGDNQTIDAQTPQWVNVILHMNGPIFKPTLSFDLALENMRGQGSLAYDKLLRVNNNDQQKIEQVTSLLLVGSFFPPDGGGFGSSAKSGALNNLGQLVSSTASSGLTKIINKVLGDRNLNVAVKYNNYNINDQTSSAGGSRNLLKLGLTKNYFNNRLTVSLGGTSDWGRQVGASSAATNLNIAQDFRVQYALSEYSGLRLNAFSTSDYDVTLDRNIQRNGVGISWHKSFDNLGEFFKGNKIAREQKRKLEVLKKSGADTLIKKELSNPEEGRAAADARPEQQK